MVAASLVGGVCLSVATTFIDGAPTVVMSATAILDNDPRFERIARMLHGLTDVEIRELSRGDLMAIAGDDVPRALAILFYKKLHAACYVPSFVLDHSDFMESCCSPRRMFIRAHDARQKKM